MAKKQKIRNVAMILGLGLFFSISAGVIAIKNSKMSVEKQKDIVNELNKMVSEMDPSDKIESLLNKNIKKMNKEYASDGINAYLHSLYQANANLSSKMGYLGVELANFAKENNIDLTKNSNMISLKDGLMKGFIQEVKNNYMSFKYDGSNYFIVVDMDYIMNKYKKYMTDDLESYIAFRDMEDNAVIYNGETGKINLMEVAERLKVIEAKKTQWENTKYKEQWAFSHKYYYEILFGINHSYFLEGSNSEKISKDVLKTYKELTEKYKGTDFEQELQGFVEKIEKAQGVISPEADNYRSSVIEKKFAYMKESNDLQ